MVKFTLSALCLLLSANQALATWDDARSCDSGSCIDGQAISFPADNQFENFCNNVVRKCNEGGDGAHIENTVHVGGSFSVHWIPHHGTPNAVSCPANYDQCMTGVSQTMACGNGQSINRSVRFFDNEGQRAGDLAAIGSCFPTPGPKEKRAEGFKACM